MVRIQIDDSNAAFDDTPASEIARILRKIADDLQDMGVTPERIRDINGNTVGTVWIEDRR